MSENPTLLEATRIWFRIGVTSFGGPAGQIALMHRELVDQRPWLTEKQFLTALHFCMLLPGPEAMQLATYAGWRLHGVRGGLIAGLLFVIPGALVIALLAAVYLLYGAVPWVMAALFGIKAAVLVIIFDALLKIKARALKDRFAWILAALAFIGIFVLALPFPLIILIAGLAGFFLREKTEPSSRTANLPFAQTVRTATLWLAIWILPLLALAMLLGSGHVMSQIAFFFSKLAIVTFGGAYAVLAYMAQAAVDTYGWLEPAEMIDALGLAETTPGPLILVTEFVGFIAAARDSGGISLTHGLAGAAVTLWATFAPCFLWIFALAPHVERLGEIEALQKALAAITAAVVGVILNLSIWFAINVVWLDDSVQWDVLIYAAIAGLMLFKFKRSVIETLLASSIAAVLVRGFLGGG